jgi:photosystem II stability/assembly factor-like uncharacterized protein
MTECSKRIDLKFLLAFSLFSVVAFANLAQSKTEAHLSAPGTPGQSLRLQSQSSFSDADVNVWTATGPGAPGVLRVVVDPSNSSTVYLGTTRGLFKSSDAGKKWMPINDGLPGIVPITGLAIGSINTSVLLAGTGAVVGYSVYRSTDGGATWNASTQGVAQIPVYSLTIDPHNENIAYAATNKGCYKSTDGGVSWTSILAIISTSFVVVDPSNSSRLFAGNAFGCYRSADGGQHWQLVDLALTTVAAIAIDPTNSAIVYAATPNGVYKSTNGGDYFTLLTEGLQGAAGIATLAIDPSDPSIIYAGSSSSTTYVGPALGLYKSTDGGQHWVRDLVGPDIQQIAISTSSPSVLYVGSALSSGIPSQYDEGGLLKSTDRGATWDQVNTGPPYGSVRWIGAPSAGTVYAGSVIGMYKSTDYGATWNSTGLVGPPVYSGAVDPSNSQIIYAATSDGVYKTLDGGATWRNIGLSSNYFVYAIAIDPSTPTTVYAGLQFGGAYKSLDGGSNWTKLVNAPDNIQGLAVKPVGGLAVYAGTHQGVFRSLDAGATWAPANNGLFLDRNQGPKSFRFDPHNPNILYLVGDGLAKTTDGGDNWSYLPPINNTSARIPSDAAVPISIAVQFIGPTAPLAVDPTNSSTLYLRATRSTNGGLNWIDFLTGLPNNGWIAAMAVDVSGTYVYAATDSGLYVNKYGSCSYSLPVTRYDWPYYDGGPAPDGVKVEAGNGCPWMATSNVNWLVVQAIIDPYVYYWIDQNPSSVPRTGTMTIAGQTFTVTQPGKPGPAIQLSSTTYLATKGDPNNPRVNITVPRTGDTSGAASVNFATIDDAGLTNCNVFTGTASPRCDYENTMGTLTWAAGDATPKSFSVAIVADSYAKGTLTFRVALSNPTGATLGSPSIATITILDNPAVDGPNPIDNTNFFVRQQYIDFLGREPDPTGFASWTSTIINCAPGDTSCDRIRVSQLFFQSQEFQERGYFVYRFYPVALGRKPDYAEFVVDLAGVSGFLDNNQLEAAKVAFITGFMARPAFVSAYSFPNTPTGNQQYVDALLNTAGVTLSSRQAMIDGLNNSTTTRAVVLRQIVESAEVSTKYNHQAYAVMEYFGYLRRQPDGAYLAWIAFLDGSSDPRGMVIGFVNSIEYRNRFGQ